MKKLFLLFGVLFLASVSTAQNQVVPVNGYYNGNFTGNDNFFYMLPKTAFTVKVTVVKTKEMKGYYSEYAERLLGLSNIIHQNRTAYKLKNISVEPVIIPDTNNLFAVELSSAQKKKNFLSKLYADKKSSPYNSFSEYNVTSSPIPDFFRNYADLAYMETDDSFVETTIIDGVVTQVPVTKTKVVSKTMAQQAQEAADLIAKIRKDRYDILAGVNEVPYSEGAFEFIVKELTETEQNYLQLFTGFTIEEEENYTFTVSPDGSETMPLFSFDTETGFHSVNSYKSEQNYYLSIDPLVTHNRYNVFEFSRKAGSKNGPNNGYRIRNAVPASLSLIKNENKIHYFGIYDIYQLGKIETLPALQDDFDITQYGIIY